MRMSNKTVLITGGNSGIGFATAKRMVAEGAVVAITGRNEETLARSREALGERAFSYRVDATDFAAIGPALSHIAQEVGGFDAAFLNAGDASFTPVGATTEAQFDHLISTNLK